MRASNWSRNISFVWPNCSNRRTPDRAPWGPPRCSEIATPSHFPIYPPSPPLMVVVLRALCPSVMAEMITLTGHFILTLLAGLSCTCTPPRPIYLPHPWHPTHFIVSLPAPFPCRHECIQVSYQDFPCPPSLLLFPASITDSYHFAYSINLHLYFYPNPSTKSSRVSDFLRLRFPSHPCIAVWIPDFFPFLLFRVFDHGLWNALALTF